MKTLQICCLLAIILLANIADGKRENPKKSKEAYRYRGNDLKEELDTYKGKHKSSHGKQSWGYDDKDKEYRKGPGKHGRGKSSQNSRFDKMGWWSSEELPSRESSSSEKSESYLAGGISKLLRTFRLPQTSSIWKQNEINSTELQSQENETTFEWYNIKRHNVGNFSIFRQWFSKNSNCSRGSLEWQSNENSTGLEQNSTKQYRFGNLNIFRKWWSEDSEESEDSHEHSKGGHRHSSRKFGHGWKHSRHFKASRESSSEESEEERMSTTWCKKWCQKWASSFRNLPQQFPNTGKHRHESYEKRIARYCQQKVNESGIMCNYNGSVTTPPTTGVPVTVTRTIPRRCRTNEQCEQDECCALHWSLGLHGRFCTKYGQEGESCTQPEYWTNYRTLARIIPSQSCPCSEGLECIGSGLSQRSVIPRVAMNSLTGVCKESVTTVPTPTEGNTNPTASQTPLERNTSSPVPTAEPAVPCTDHLDCPFLQCCANATTDEFGKRSQGRCMPFSDKFDQCTRLSSFSSQPVVAACPCQSSLECSLTNTDVGDAYGICV